MVLDWAVRALAPAWLRAAHLDAEAAALEACAEIGGISGVMAAREPMRDAFRRADAARRANWEWAVDWNDWTMTVWEDVDATWNAARTAADGIWLKEADQALDAAVCGTAVVWATAGEDALLAAIGKQLQRDALELVDRLMAVGLAAARRPWPGTTMRGEISANKFRFTQYRPGKGAGTRQSHAVRL